MSLFYQKNITEYALAIIGIAGAMPHGVGVTANETLAFRADPMAPKKVKKGGVVLDLLGLPVDLVKSAPRLSLSGEPGCVDINGYVGWWAFHGAKVEWV